MARFEFDHKKVFVMDGDSPLGKEIISTFVELQATVISMSKSSDKHECALYYETANKKVKLGALDFNSPNVLEELTTILLKTTKTVDVFINNSKKVNSKGILELSSNEWEDELFVNLDIPFLLLKAIIPLLKESGLGSIINMSSLSVINGGLGEVGFASVKSATESINKALSRELNDFNVRVNCISFSHDDLEINSTQGVRYIDIVNTILFLSSSLSSYINGQVLLVDGGRTYQ